MLAIKETTDKIIGPSDDPSCRSARDSILKAQAAVQEAKDRLARLQRILRESRDGLERTDAKLDMIEAERDVLILGREVELARRAEAEIRREVLKRLQAHYRPKFKQALKELDAVFSGPVYEANERARLVWNEANTIGVKLPVYFCQYFLPDGPRMTSWHNQWRRTLLGEGWLDD